MSDTPRTACEVVAAVASARCDAGRRLDNVMPLAHQATEWQRSGLCQEDGAQTITRRPAPEARVPVFSSLSAAH